MPGFDAATGWLNSPPLTAEDLRGKVVLVDFWTYTCINWLRTLAYVRAWAEKYQERGLVVVGVHTPEFPFERDIENVRPAAKDMNVWYPIALDSDYEVWRAFSNRYWPAVYIADAQGRIRHHQFGEGGYDDCERGTQQLLREAGAEGVADDLVSLTPDGFEAQADWTNLRSPETYLGSAQGQNFASRGGAEIGRPARYDLPNMLMLNQWAVSGDWTIESGERAERWRWTHRLPLPRTRRPSRHACARRARAVPGVRRRRATGRRSRARRRRAGPRNGHRTAALSAGSRARADRRPHRRDRLYGSRRRGLRVHVRLVRFGRGRLR
jgi:thiol-disulfide isomerase/thioredoxin